MAKGDKSIATEGALLALDIITEVKDEIRKSYGHSVGYEEMSRKEMRALIRKGLDGDPQARDEVNKLHQVNQYPDGRNPVEDEINIVLAEVQEKQKAELGTILDIAGDKATNGQAAPMEPVEGGLLEMALGGESNA